MASSQEKQVDFSKIAARPLLPALDANNNLVYVPSYAWWYIDPSDGSIVLDLRKRNEWARRTGYVIVVEPFVHCDERDCYRDFLDCDKFVLYPNYTIVELNERAQYIKVKRNGDGVVFKIPHITVAYLFAELEPGMTFCEAVPLFTAILAKLGKLTKEDMELLDKDPVKLEVEHAEILTDALTNLGVAPGLIIVQKKE